jgi:hypothetical protein
LARPLKIRLECDFRVTVTAGGGKTMIMMAFQTTKGVTAAAATHWHTP